MLIVLNVSFCLFSMPVVILQIVYYSMASDISNSLKSLSNFTLDSLFLTLSITPNYLTVTKPYSHVVPEFVDITSSSHQYSSKIDTLDILKAVAELLQFLNHSSNFFLYCFTGKAFRKETKRLILKWFRFLKNVKCFCNKRSKNSKFHIQYD